MVGIVVVPCGLFWELQSEVHYCYYLWIFIYYQGQIGGLS